MKCIASILCLFVIVVSHAQSGTPEWHAGVKGDVNYSNIRGNGVASGYTVGVQAGGFLERTFNSKWSIQPELLFSQNNTKRGSDFLKYYNTSGNPFAADDIKLAYLSIPVLLKYNVNKTFSLLAGPQYGLLLVDAESLMKSGDGKAFKKGEFSADFGAQFNVGRVAIYGRYNLGISNINNIDTRYQWRSSHIQAGIAVKIL